jgi:hypothetical protein
MTKIVRLSIMNLVTPKHELLFNKPAFEADLLNKIPCLVPTLGVTKFTRLIAMNLVKLGFAT